MILTKQVVLSELKQSTINFIMRADSDRLQISIQDTYFILRKPAYLFLLKIDVPSVLVLPPFS